MTHEPPSIVSLLKERSVYAGRELAVQCEDSTLTWSQLDEVSNRIAHGLSSVGVTEGDFVSIALQNGTDFISATYAIWKAGAIPQPISHRLPIGETRAIIELANSKVVISNERLEIERPVLSTSDLASLSNRSDDLPVTIARSWKAPTSGGSTGRPKLIVSNSPAVRQDDTIAMWRMSSSDITLMPGPLYHNAPFITVFPSLMTGAKVVLMPRFDAEETLRLIDDCKVTWLYLVPTMMIRILKLPAHVRDRYDISSLQTLWHMAAPCPRWVKSAWIDYIGADKIWELYGGTENIGFTTIGGYEWLQHPGSVGTLTYGDAIEAFSEDGSRLERTAVGELFIRNQSRTAYHYIGAESRTLPGGWESLGDFGSVDHDGYVFLADRRSDLILVGGANVYPAEVEAAIDQHPKVESSCVIGLPDDDLGQSVHAVVCGRDDLTIGSLRDFLSRRLAKPKLPKSYQIVNESLRDDAGKIRRSQVRDRFVNQSYRAEQVSLSM